MFLRIEPASGVPITRQITDQIRLMCASGDLTPGQRLPSVRALARELAVNQNTILRVYERLTGEGLLERRHGDGTYVSGTVSPDRRRSQQRQLNVEAEQLAYHAQTLNISRREVCKLVERAFDAMGDGGKGKEQEG